MKKESVSSLYKDFYRLMSTRALMQREYVKIGKQMTQIETEIQKLEMSSPKKVDKKHAQE